MEEQHELSKGLGLAHVFTIAAGAMIGSGLFILPGLAHAMAGPGVIWSYVLAGLLATTGALSMAELVTAMPKAGRDYFYVVRGFGAGTGSIAGVLSWFALTLKSAFCRRRHGHVCGIGRGYQRGTQRCGADGWFRGAEHPGRP
ncbi:MAG: APC family permease [Kiritimatiellae bacterium]|nr:APC family permease [Kiritimatiellia bacterium]